jgi:hypothetical protein
LRKALRLEEKHDGEQKLPDSAGVVYAKKILVEEGACDYFSALLRLAVRQTFLIRDEF